MHSSPIHHSLPIKFIAQIQRNNVILKKSKSIVLILFFLCSLPAQANILPVVVETNYQEGRWQPLPSEKIKTAAADSALQEISATKQFAFFKNKPKNINSGFLSVTIHLIEDAQIVSVHISLNQPDKASMVATHSESIKNLYYDGIYQQFKRAGTQAAKKLITNLIKISPEKPDMKSNNPLKYQIDQLNNELVNINQQIIKQNNITQTIQNEFELTSVLRKLNKLDQVIGSLDKQDKKLDIIIDEVSQLNQNIKQQPRQQVNINQKYILENSITGQNTIPTPPHEGPNENQAQVMYNQAQILKRDTKYRDAETLLNKALKLDISAELKTLIADELYYQLPMFEAQSIAIDLGRNFKKYASANQHHEKLNRIRDRYEYALGKNQHNFQRTRKIQQMLDQHINTSRAMSASISIQSQVNFRMIHQQMEQRMMMSGHYPDKNSFEKILQQSRIPHSLISYKTDKYGYRAKFKSLDGRMISIKSNRSDFEVID